MNSKGKISLFLIVLMAYSLLFISYNAVDPVKSETVTYITSNTTWTKTNSTSTFTGQMVVNEGATLTLERGVTINMNNYLLFVNGTLKSVGTQAETNVIFGGNITFGTSATDSSLFNNTVINSNITSTKTLTIHNCNINAVIFAGNNSVITSNKINAELTVANACTVTDNNISGKGFPRIPGDQDYLSTGNACNITSNNINFTLDSSVGYTYYALSVSNNSIVMNNSISGGARVYYSIVKNCNITDYSPALLTYGNCTVTSNFLKAKAEGIGLLIPYGAWVAVTKNVIYGNVPIVSHGILLDNLITYGGIQIGKPDWETVTNQNLTIRNNIIGNTSLGIWSEAPSSPALLGTPNIVIEHNLIVNTTAAVSLKLAVSAIKNNTIVSSETAILLYAGSPLINYNNFLNYTKNSLALSSNFQDINATYNWWEKTDIQEINHTIHDLKNDINLGRVTFMPTLTIQNAYAPTINYSLELPPIPPEPVPSPSPTSTPILTSTSNPTPTETTHSPTTTNSPTTQSSSPNTTPAPSIPEIVSAATLLLFVLGTTFIVIYLQRKRLLHNPHF